MIARPRQTASLLGRHLPRLGAQAGGHRAANVGGSAKPGASIPRRSRHLGGQPQDRALYACDCGLAFDALVSTSVDCPGCGTTQAW